MLWTPIRRPSRLARSRLRLALFCLLGVLVLDFFLIALSHPPTRRVPLNSVGPSEQKIFIASIHRNSERILRTHWNEAIVNLAKHFGLKNVFVSIHESGSQDNTKGALRDLDFELKELGVHRTIELDKTLDEQVAEIMTPPETVEDGWITTPRGKLELRRIPYLAKLRNRVMEKLDIEAKMGRTYDVVLWLNDVVFTTEDIVTLLATRDGHYDAVCSLDYSVPFIYYDTFALRDSSGSKAVPQMWPYFLSSASRDALRGNLPVPVQSCWNGVVAFKAEPFYASPPLRFRGVSDSLAMHHLEGSECCLIHADNQRLGSEGVWLNPNVRVGYNTAAYEAVNPKNGGLWPTWREKVRGVWQNRLSRWLVWPRRLSEKWQVKRKVRAWEAEKEGHHEEAVGCLINEMQVLVENGWQHV